MRLPIEARGWSGIAAVSWSICLVKASGYAKSWAINCSPFLSISSTVTLKYYYIGPVWDLSPVEGPNFPWSSFAWHSICFASALSSYCYGLTACVLIGFADSSFDLPFFCLGFAWSRRCSANHGDAVSVPSIMSKLGVLKLPELKGEMSFEFCLWRSGIWFEKNVSCSHLMIWKSSACRSFMPWGRLCEAVPSWGLGAGHVRYRWRDRYCSLTARDKN